MAGEILRDPKLKEKYGAKAESYVQARRATLREVGEAWRLARDEGRGDDLP